MILASSEYELRERCRALCAQYPDLPRLKTIAAVGAYDAEIGGAGVDSQRLTGILNYLLDCGYLVDPGFEIDVVNFREGRDFLREDKKADLVFVSYILGCRPFNDAETFKSAAEMEARPDYPLSLCTLLSWRNHDYGWSKRLVAADAKMIATYGGNYEVGTNFLKFEFDVLIPSPDEECAGNRAESIEEMRPLYPALNDIDVPMGWLGFAGNTEYLAAIAPALNAQTCLGRRGFNAEALPEKEPEPTAAPRLVDPFNGSRKKFKMEEPTPGYRKLKSNRAYRFR